MRWNKLLPTQKRLVISGHGAVACYARLENDKELYREQNPGTSAARRHAEAISAARRLGRI